MDPFDVIDPSWNPEGKTFNELREYNILDNQRILRELGLGHLPVPGLSKPEPPKKVRQRKPRVKAVSEYVSSPRRSPRLGKVQKDYNEYDSMKEESETENSTVKVLADMKNKEYSPKRTTYVERSILLHPRDITDEMLEAVADNVSEKEYSQERGTCCHQCRQKTSDMKTYCRSKTCIGIRGQFCGPCLKNRYGECVREALMNENWTCPPCRDICNCSLCRRRLGKLPTGILAPNAKTAGYASVKHLLEHEENDLV